jgi:hypothetical protein
VIADQRGCDDVTAIDPTLYAYDEVTATCTGLGQVDIATFKTDALRDKWIKIAEQFSTIEDSGHLYVIAS